MLKDLFLELIKVPSPSGSEKKVAELIQQKLKQLGLASNFDQAGAINGSNTGNLITTLKGSKNQPTILFVAHIDTVETGDQLICPIIEGDTIKTDNSTILGADNKASVACLIELLSKVKEWEERPTIVAAFTTREEQGQMGVSLLKLSQKIDYAFNLDGKGEIGGFAYKALGHLPFELEIIGREVHSAHEPETGINALLVASQIIRKLPLGKTKSGNVLNIGKIESGKATNIVPGYAKMQGEIRSFTQKGIKQQLENVTRITEKICQKYGARYKLLTKEKEGAPVFNGQKNSQISNVAKKACEKLGLTPNIFAGTFTCEANFLSQMGYPVLNVCRGGLMPHSKEESIKVSELDQLLKLLVSLTEEITQKNPVENS